MIIRSAPHNYKMDDNISPVNLYNLHGPPLFTVDGGETITSPLPGSRGRFYSRRSDTFCRSNSLLPKMTDDYKTCFRVGHFGGQMQKV